MKKAEECILTDVAVGTRVTILKLTAGGRAEAQLVGLGVRPGVTVEVHRNDKGPILISVANTRVALGRKRAAKIWVQALS